MHGSAFSLFIEFTFEIEKSRGETNFNKMKSFLINKLVNDLKIFKDRDFFEERNGIKTYHEIVIIKV